jgi:S1-C subfamily serine protease
MRNESWDRPRCPIHRCREVPHLPLNSARAPTRANANATGVRSDATPAIRSLTLSLLGTAVVGAIGTWFLTAHQPSPEKIAATMLRSTVAVHIEDRAGSPLGSGSGFVVARGVIATCLHVIEGGWRGTVRVGSTAHSIKGLLATDRKHDLALIAVEGAEPALPLSATHPAVAEPVFVAGNPQGLEGTFSQGVISAVRNWRDGRLLQMSAAVSPGSSGGPVLNARGEVIGVTTMSLTTGQNLNFAVPVEYVVAVMNKSIGASPLPLINAVLDRDRAGLIGLVHTVAKRYTSKTMRSETVTTLDVFGHVVERRYSQWNQWTGSSSGVYTAEYDDEHRIVSDMQQNGSEQTRCRYNHTNDSSGAMRGVRLCESGEGLDEGEIVEFDSLGRPVVEELFRPYCSPDGPYRKNVRTIDDLFKMLVTKHHFDAAGCDIEQQYVDPCPGGSSQLMRIKCDNQNRQTEVVSTTTLANGSTVGYKETAAYSPGTVTRTRIENGAAKTTTCSLELDSIGNWLAETCAVAGRPDDDYAMRRVITYY